MSISSDSAEQLTRLYLDEVEFALKITGSATQHIIGALYAIAQDKKNNSAKAKLKNMLTEDNSMKIFEIKKSDMKIFAKEAKSYGVSYTVVKDKVKPTIDEKDKANEVVDIMVMGKDAPKVNRIMTKYNLTTTPKAEIQKEDERQIEKSPIVENVEEQVVSNNIDDNMIDDIFAEAKPKEEIQEETIKSPSKSETEKKQSPQLEDSSMNKTHLNGEDKTGKKESVREDLKKCREEVRIEQEKRKAERNIANNPVKKKKSKKKARGK